MILPRITGGSPFLLVHFLVLTVATAMIDYAHDIGDWRLGMLSFFL